MVSYPGYAGSTGHCSSGSDFVLPLDFHGRLRIIGTMFIPGALHGIAASFHADTNLRKLRTAIFRAVWSGRQPLANAGAVLSLLDGPSGCDTASCVVWFRFRMLRRYLAYRPRKVHRVYRLIDGVAEGCPGRGPAHLLVESAAEIGFQWDSCVLVWERPGLPVLCNLAGPIQHFRAAVLYAWRNKISTVFVARKGFRGGPLLDIRLWVYLLAREGGEGWNGFLLVKVQGQLVPCRFCGGADNDGHLFWDCPFPPLGEIREHPEFYGLPEVDKYCWPRCLLWHGWLPLLSGANGGSPWPRTLLMVLVICLSVLLVLSRLVSKIIGGYRLGLMLGLQQARFFFTGHAGHLWVDRRWGPS